MAHSSLPSFLPLVIRLCRPSCFIQVLTVTGALSAPVTAGRYKHPIGRLYLPHFRVYRFFSYIVALVLVFRFYFLCNTVELFQILFLLYFFLLFLIHIICHLIHLNVSMSGRGYCSHGCVPRGVFVRILHENPEFLGAKRRFLPFLCIAKCVIVHSTPLFGGV